MIFSEALKIQTHQKPISIKFPTLKRKEAGWSARPLYRQIIGMSALT